MTDTLKPCPWCGAEVYVYGESTDVGMYWCIRHKIGPCNVAVRTRDKSKTIAAWNTRALDDANYRAGLRAAAKLTEELDDGRVNSEIARFAAYVAASIRALPTPSTLPSEAPQGEGGEG